MGINLTKSHSEPGYTLAPQEIRGNSSSLDLSLTYTPIRQRQENLYLQAAIEGRNVTTTLLGYDFSKDKIRALRLSATYETMALGNGTDQIGFTFSQGITGLGSNKNDAPNLSRDGTHPNFTKAEIVHNHLEPLFTNYLLSSSFKGQLASRSLLSSEEFGYGGTSAGRAYDNSEILGDNGLSLALELRKNDIPEWLGLQTQPFIFYDIGKVWNRNAAQTTSISASSTGAGLRVRHMSGLNGSMQLAYPLTKTIETPLYGTKNTSPRVLLQLGYTF